MVAWLRRLGPGVRAVYEVGPTGFLLRRALIYPGPGGAWTQAHLAWLARLDFDDAASTVTMADYLAAVQALVQRRTTLDAAIAELVPTSPYAATVPVLRCFRGIDTLSARGCAPRSATSPASPTPGCWPGSWGSSHRSTPATTTARKGAITKAGPAHARRLLVEAAHHYRRPPHLGVTLQRRQAGADPRVCAIAWRAQQRLYRQWQLLHVRRRKPAGVVAVACARELLALEPNIRCTGSARRM